jgi:hypothetical protein
MNTRTQHQPRNPQTLLVESLLRDGMSLSTIARQVGISKQRVHQISTRVRQDRQALDGGGLQGVNPVISHLPMKSLTIRFTPAVYDALVEACQIVNRKDTEEQITIQDYVEQCTINNLVELGLMRKHRKHK